MDETDLETVVAAAEEAVAALDEAVAAAGDDADPALLERAAKLRAAEDDKEPEGDAGDTTDDNADLTDEEKKKEEEAVRGLRSLAATYGDGMTKLVNDAVKLGARSAEIRASLKAAVLKRGATSGSAPQNLKPQPQGHRSAPAIDTAAIYARRNKQLAQQKPAKA
jgi:hypothetical protein